MIWQNVWAWAGLIAIGLPVLIHLLGRGHARVQPFPTLRFLESSRLLPTRRTRVHDWILLAVRIGILAAAVTALAQPLLLTAARTRTLDRALARAIIVDTSATMLRAAAVAQREATRLAGEAQTSTVLESGAPVRAIAGAIAWLARQPGRAELVVISDFQLGTIDSTSLAAIPGSIGIRLSRIALTESSAPIETRARFGTAEAVTRISPQSDRTDAEWGPAVVSTNGFNDVPLSLAGASERAGANAATAAASAVGVRLPLDSAHARAVAIVYPRFEQRVELLRNAKPVADAWMVDIIARLRSDSMLIAAAARVSALASVDTTNGLVVARDQSGRAIVSATHGAVQGSDRLLLISLADAGSLTSAALVAATRRALSAAPALSELEPATLADNVLAAWQRAPSADVTTRTNASANTGASDGRWLWILALLLLGLETWLRRVPRTPIAADVAHDRAA